MNCTKLAGFDVLVVYGSVVIDELHKDCLGSKRGKSRVLAVAQFVQVDRPSLFIQSRVLVPLALA